jgi:HEAT repeat protein
MNEGKTLSEWVKLTKSKDPKQRAEAAERIGEIKDEAKSALPALLELNKDKEYEVRAKAIEGVGRIGEALKGKGPEVKAAMTVLLDALKDKKAPDNEDEVLLEVLRALGRITEEEQPMYAKTVATACMPFLKHKNPYVQGTTAGVMSDCGEAGKAAVPALIEIARSKESYAADGAREALRNLDPEAAKKAGIR